MDIINLRISVLLKYANLSLRVYFCSELACNGPLEDCKKCNYKKNRLEKSNPIVLVFTFSQVFSANFEGGQHGGSGRRGRRIACLLYNSCLLFNLCKKICISHSPGKTCHPNKYCNHRNLCASKSYAVCTQNPSCLTCLRRNLIKK
jgi:hypothetical protein